MKINTQKKTIKKLLSAVLTASIITTSFASLIQANARTTGEDSNQVIAEIQTSANQTEQTKEIVINNKNDFIIYMDNPVFRGNNYKITLACDINMEGTTVDPIKEFSGEFDGCGHTISNLKVQDISVKNINDIAFIRTLNSQAKIKNVTFNNYTVDSKSKNIQAAAGLVVTNHGNISGVKVYNGSISINGKVYTGGFVNDNAKDGTIKDCFFEGNVSGYVVGGFVNENFGTIKDCRVKGKVSCNRCTGGFCDKNSGEIISCSSECTVGAIVYAGGFIVENSGKVKDCNAEGEVTCLICAGGFAGINYSEIINCKAIGKATANLFLFGTRRAGGFVGENEKGTIISCTATGGADSQSSSGQAKAGGFAGINKANITNCYAHGKATAKTKKHTALAGGFVGENEKGTIISCEATGGADSQSSSGQAKAGGFAGINKANITDSSVNTKKNVKVYLSSGIGRTDNGCGGFVGKNDKGGSIKNCYATTSVETTNHKKGGGFVGEAKNNSEIYDSRCDTKLLISKNGETKQAAFCQDNDHKKAVIENCYDFILIKLNF